jgi:hypothetical protein
MSFSQSKVLSGDKSGSGMIIDWIKEADIGPIPGLLLLIFEARIVMPLDVSGHSEQRLRRQNCF